MVTFSIITPVYNGEKYIEETIQSVLKAAKAFSYEYLVIDDGSTDNTKDILSKYLNQIVYVKQENSGQSAAINRAIGLIKGKYSVIVNADDPLITEELFLEAMLILDSQPHIVATYPDWQIINETGNTLEVVKVKEFSIDELVGRFNCLVGPGGIFRSDAAKKIGGWDHNFRFVPDYDFWLRMSDLGSFKHVPKVQATWRTHSDSISIGSRGKDMAEERIRVISNYVSRNPNLSEEIKKMAIANSTYRAAVLSFFDKRVSGRKLVCKSLIMYPRLLVEKNPLVLAFLLCTPFSGYITSFLSKCLNLGKIEENLRRSIKG
jgi:glycosyltransferase involved in cell wall biosynthesis